MASLDSKDKKILFAVNNEARQPLSKIASETNLPRHVVKRRLEQLEKTKIIKAYKLKINHQLLGQEEYEVYLRLMDFDGQRTKKLIKSLVANNHVSWIGLCFGNYDLKISFYAKNNKEFFGILSESLTGFRDIIKAQETLSLTKKYKMDSSLFLETILKEKFSPNTKNEKVFISKKRTKKTEKVILDSNDKKLISLLSKKPTATLSELSKELNMSLQGVKNRLEALYAQKIILGTSALINGQALGFIWATCLFKLALDENGEEELEKYTLTMSGTTSAVRLLGKWDLGVTFFSESIKDLQESINDFKAKFKDNIKDYDSLIILESYKYPLIPECILE
ncbi:MAG: Lrp/AsnC family transcriptional regulator [Candidatus Nanoarchaeia archaeon]